jgi:hypothetical protein
MDFELYSHKTDWLCFMDVIIQKSGLGKQITSTNDWNKKWMNMNYCQMMAKVYWDILKNWSKYHLKDMPGTSEFHSLHWNKIKYSQSQQREV